MTIAASALLLDMDGTLVDSTAAVERIWSDWAVVHGLDPEKVIPVIHGRQGQESMSILLPERPADLNIRENSALLARETAETDGVVAISGAEEFLASLAGVPHALVTSADRGLAEARMMAAALELPRVAVTAEMVAASKPHPEGFLLGARALGVMPAACVAFEDSAAGITAARAAGMRVVGVGVAAKAHGADWTIADLTGVKVTTAGSTIEILLAELL